MLIPLLILGSLSILITQRFVKEEINKSSKNLVLQVKDNIETVFNELDLLSLTFDGESDIVVKFKELLSKDSADLDNLNSLSFLKSFLIAISSARPYIYSFNIYYKNDIGQYISSSNSITNLRESIDTGWYESYKKQKPGTKIWTELRDIKRYAQDTQPLKVLTIYKTLVDGNGVIVLNIPADYFEKNLRKIVTSPNHSLLIADENNNIVFTSNGSSPLTDRDTKILAHSDNDFFSYLSVDGNRYTVSKIQSPRYNWKYISVISQNTLYQVPVRLSKYTFYLLVLSFTLGLFLTYFLTRRKYRQVLNIIFILESAEKGNALPPLADRVKDEYDFIIQNILKTFIEHSYLKVQLSERKYKAQAMELLALQSQVNPHFLYNTFQSIYWEVLSLTGRPNKANEMIESLSDILRYSLSNHGKDVTIEEEINNTRNYIDIQKQCYKDRFDVTWKYADNILNYRIIKMLLQPLIENSIHHGILKKKAKGKIKIKIAKVGNFIRIAVIDNGLGIQSDKLKELQKGLERDDGQSNHIGLMNTNKRLRLTYGDQCKIYIKSKYGIGTVEYITIPAQL